MVISMSWGWAHCTVYRYQDQHRGGSEVCAGHLSWDGLPALLGAPYL